MQIKESDRAMFPLDYYEASFSNEFTTLEEELNSAELRMKDLVGKKTLIVGAGPLNKYSQIAESGLDLVFIDPLYNRREEWLEQEGNVILGPSRGGMMVAPVGLKTVAGIAEALPFGPCFDFVIANASTPSYSPSVELAWKSMDEMIRVLKPGGDLRVYPYFIEPSFVSGMRQNVGNSDYYKLPDRLLANDASFASLLGVLSEHERSYLDGLQTRKDLRVDVSGYMTKSGHLIAGLAVKKIK
jgi:hypothetical protein